MAPMRVGWKLNEKVKASLFPAASKWADVREYIRARRPDPKPASEHIHLSLDSGEAINYEHAVVDGAWLTVTIDEAPAARSVSLQTAPYGDLSATCHLFARNHEEGYDTTHFCMDEENAHLRTTLDDVIHSGVTLLRAPPGSGKTTFGQVVGRYAATRRMQVVYIVGEAHFGSFEEIWADATRGGDWKHVTDITFPTIIIIDEAQALYEEGTFGSLWSMVKQLLSWGGRAGRHVRFLFLATYGPVVLPKFSPIMFDYDYGLHSLRLRPSEANLVAQKYADMHRITMTQDMVETVYGLSGGYAGIFREALFILHKELDISSRPSYLVSHAFRDQLIHAYPLIEIAQLPMRTDRELRDLARQAILECNAELRFSVGFADHRFKPLVRAGILIQEGDFSFQFSSPVVFDILLQAFMTTGIRPEPTQASFEAVLTDILRRVGGNHIFHINTGRWKPLEDAWQKQFLVAAASVIDVAVAEVITNIGSRFGRSDAFMDFYLNGDIGWGVELTREGSELEERVARFITGRYASFELNFWAVIDFRRTIPDLANLCENVWYVVYEDNFSRFTLYRAHEKPTIIDTYVNKA